MQTKDVRSGGSQSLSEEHASGEGKDTGNQDIQSSLGRGDGPKSEEQDASSPKKNNHEGIDNEAAKYNKANPINRKKDVVKLKKIAKEVGKAQDAEMDILPAKIAAALGGAAIGQASGEVVKLGFARNDVVADGFELRHDTISGGVHDNTAFWIFPRSLSLRALVF
nr:hypothetical protein CFP56_51734 [Quercus suber]